MMIKKLRRRIVSTTMTTLVLTMTVLVIVVNSLTAIANNSTADETIDRYYHIAQYVRDNSAERGFVIPEDDTSYSVWVIDEDEQSWQHYIIVWYRFDGSREMIFIGSNFISQEDALEYVKKAEVKRSYKGWLDYFRYGKFVEEDGSGFLVMSDEVTERSRIDSMFHSSIITSAITCLVVLVIAILFSKRVTKPVERAMENQKRFVTDASHELKTPITILSANNDIIELNHGEDDLTKSNRMQLERMSTLLQKMMDMSRYDEHTEDIEKENFSLSEAVFDTAMSFTSLIEKSGKQIDIELDQNIEINSDEAKVRQLVAILMDNAVKYCDENGKILLKLTKGKKPVLQIENTCSGVDKMSLNLLFERFYRADKARTGGSGYGLGLSIAKSICEVCGFDIKVNQSGIERILFTVKF